MSMKLDTTLEQLLSSVPKPWGHLVERVLDPSGVADRMNVKGARALELAQQADLTFCKSSSPDLLDKVRASCSLFLVTTEEVVGDLPAEVTSSRVIIVSPKPRLLLALLLSRRACSLEVAAQTERIHPSAKIDPSATIGPGVVVGADVEIGAHCIVGPNSTLDHVSVGAGTQIGCNCTIGADGFGFEVEEMTGDVVKFPHFGRVIVGCNVEIFNNVCVARGSLGDTVIEDGVRIDNLVHVAHNVRIGRGALVIANAMLGGSTDIGAGVWLGPSTSVINGITVGAVAMTGMGAVVTKSVEANAVVAGVPARKLRDRFAADSAAGRRLHNTRGSQT